jgi:tRNA A37 threonylcarbamoyladenosine dehydratase
VKSDLNAAILKQHLILLSDSSCVTIAARCDGVCDHQSALDDSGLVVTTMSSSTVNMSLSLPQLLTSQDARVCIVGIGGVGSWAAEALARSGVGHLTLVDLDEVCVSNVNRQVHALTSTVGLLKGKAMAARIHDINPEVVVEAVADFLGPDNAEALLVPPGRPPFDFVLDGVDRDLEKALIIDLCCRRSIPVITVGGTGGVVSPGGLKARSWGPSV